MALRLGDIAPNFTAETTEGSIDFHEWLETVGGSCSRIPRISLRCAPLSWASARD
jgi:hypothetical protein